MYVKVLCVAVLLNLIVVKGNKIDCITPNGEHATCIPIKTCQILMDAIQTRNMSVIEFTRNSQCGYDKEPLICCGSSAHYTTQKDLVVVFPSKTEKCGIQEGGNDRIIGGNITDLAEYPWLAALEYINLLSGNKSEIRCSGSMIYDRYILTSASCLDFPNYKLNSVVLGEWQLSTNPDCIADIGFTECADPVERFNIEMKFPHPQYDPLSLQHDIALLRLDKMIKYTDYIRPICLPNIGTSSLHLASQGQASGWRFSFEDDTINDKKYKSDLRVVSTDKCKTKFGKNITINQLCMEGYSYRGFCKGSKGGPLMKVHRFPDDSETRWVQTGVASFGIECDLLEEPVVYTNISGYMDWILHTVSEK